MTRTVLSSPARRHAWAALLALGLLAACSGLAPGPTASDGADAGDPPAQDAAPISGGREMFIFYCAKCHGITGLGDGPSVGSLRTQAGLNLTILGDRSDDELYKTISAGKGIDMPPWELKLTVEQRREILAYVRTLQK